VRASEKEKEYFLRNLTHMILEAEKSHHLISASWRIRKLVAKTSLHVQRSENLTVW
jgi:hypothetical protein